MSRDSRCTHTERSWRFSCPGLFRGFFPILAVLVLCILGAGACAPSGDGIVRLEGATMGTTYRIVYPAPAASGHRIGPAIDALLDEINQSLSTYIDTSLISRINASEDISGWHPVDRHFEAVYSRARLIYEDTRGAFNPAVGPLVAAWGFGPDGARTRPSDRAVESLLPLVDFDVFAYQSSPPAVRKTVAGAELDFSAIAKGYAVDQVGQLLEARGLQSYFVEIGGEVRTAGEHPEGRPWRVGIEVPSADPADRLPAAIVSLMNGAALATSGNYRNYVMRDGQKYAHILNPETGYPEVSSLLSVTVMAADCMTADAYATALMVMGLEASLEFVREREGLEAYFISADEEGRIISARSTGFPMPELGEGRPPSRPGIPVFAFLINTPSASAAFPGFPL